MMWRFADPEKTSEADIGYCGMAGGPTAGN